MVAEAGKPGEWGGPLEGLRVLDLTRVLAGPYATQSLGDLGAEVIKVEPPNGDDTRKFPPFAGQESHYFLALNRNKKSLVIDLKQEAGKDLMCRLAAKSDILIENYRPGVMDKLGLGYEALCAINPRLIYCSISGFGQTGPLRDKPSFDIVTQAMSGALSINGEKGRPPVKLGLPIGDMVGGVYGPIAILAALHERSLTGRGRLIDISLHDGLIGMLGYLAQLSFVTGEDLDLSDQCIRQSFPTVASRRRTATSSLQFSPKHFGQSFVRHWSAQNWQRISASRRCLIGEKIVKSLRK